MEEAVEGRFRCKLADLDHVNALGKNLIAVLVDIDFEGKQVQVFGSCQLAGNETDAAVKAALNATDGNLSAHARRLEEAGYIVCRKSFDGRIPRTEYELTRQGRRELEAYLDHMEALIRAMREV